MEGVRVGLAFGWIGVAQQVVEVLPVVRLPSMIAVTKGDSST
jgi:hypothetical protein